MEKQICLQRGLHESQPQNLLGSGAQCQVPAISHGKTACFGPWPPLGSQSMQQAPPGECLKGAGLPQAKLFATVTEKRKEKAKVQSVLCSTELTQQQHACCGVS